MKDRGLVPWDASVRAEQVPIMGIILSLLEDESLHDQASSFDLAMYREELAELNDMADLEECDRVESGKTFAAEEPILYIPDSLVPYMRKFILPEIRRILEAGS